jgi:ectoine hydroxylase-related dioxygenase (phytanoyl-CoA dioxygenase family)
VPDFILEEIKKEADRHGDSVIRILLEALMAGARVVRKDYYVISNRLSEKMKGVFAVMDRKDVEKFRKKVKEIVNRGVEIELKKIEKKLRKEKKLS